MGFNSAFKGLKAEKRFGICGRILAAMEGIIFLEVVFSHERLLKKIRRGQIF